MGAEAGANITADPHRDTTAAMAVPGSFAHPVLPCSAPTHTSEHEQALRSFVYALFLPLPLFSDPAPPSLNTCFGTSIFRTSDERISMRSSSRQLLRPGRRIRLNHRTHFTSMAMSNVPHARSFSPRRSN